MMRTSLKIILKTDMWSKILCFVFSIMCVLNLTNAKRMQPSDDSDLLTCGPKILCSSSLYSYLFLQLNLLGAYHC